MISIIRETYPAKCPRHVPELREDVDGNMSYFLRYYKWWGNQQLVLKASEIKNQIIQNLGNIYLVRPSYIQVASLYYNQWRENEEDKTATFSA
jgi:hypothetical protein